MAEILHFLMQLTVNGKPISKAAVELEYRRLLKALRAHLSAEELSRRSHALQRQALDHAIGRMLLLNEAQRRDIQTPLEEIDRAVIDLIQAYGGQAGFQTHLNKLNLSLDTLRRQIQEARQMEKLIEQITAACPQPTEDEVTTCLNDHAREFIGQDTPPETIRGQIRLSLAAARKNKELSAFIARLKKDAVIQESKTGS